MSNLSIEPLRGGELRPVAFCRVHLPLPGKVWLGKRDGGCCEQRQRKKQTTHHICEFSKSASLARQRSTTADVIARHYRSNQQPAPASRPVPAPSKYALPQRVLAISTHDQGSARLLENPAARLAPRGRAARHRPAAHSSVTADPCCRTTR